MEAAALSKSGLVPGTGKVHIRLWEQTGHIHRQAEISEWGWGREEGRKVRGGRELKFLA